MQRSHFFEKRVVRSYPPSSRLRRGKPDFAMRDMRAQSYFRATIKQKKPPERAAFLFGARPMGLEPTTFGSTIRCSSQLSYGPEDLINIFYTALSNPCQIFLSRELESFPKPLVQRDRRAYIFFKGIFWGDFSTTSAKAFRLSESLFSSTDWMTGTEVFPRLSRASITYFKVSVSRSSAG